MSMNIDITNGNHDKQMMLGFSRVLLTTGDNSFCPTIK